MIQVIWFAFMSIFMFALAVPYHHWSKEGNHIWFIVLYGLTFFFANFGLNSTTFVVPAEIFPARFHVTCHWISAVSGKAGAIMGAFGFLYASQSQIKAKADAGYPTGIGMKNSLLVLVGINAIRVLLMLALVPESKGKLLEEMSKENEETDRNPAPSN